MLLACLAGLSIGCGDSSGGTNITGAGGGGSNVPAVPATVLRILLTRARIVINNSAQVQNINVALLDSSGVTLDFRGPINLAETIELPLSRALASRVAQVVIEVVYTGGDVKEVITTPVTLTIDQTNTIDTGTTTATKLTAVDLTPANGTVGSGGTLLYSVAGTFQAGSYKTTSNMTNNLFTWTSSDPTIATVDQSGLASGLVQGFTAISATRDGVTGSAFLQVNTGPVASPTPTPTPSPGSSPSASPGSSPSSSPTASPGSSPTASPGASPSSSPGASPGASPSPTGLVLSQTNATTVVGGTVRITGTVGGSAVNVTLTSGNSSIASASNDTLLGVNTGVTNFTATGGNFTAQGNITVVSGSLQSTLRLVPGTATAMSEGEQRLFQAFAQFSTGNGTVEVDVSNQCVWVVTNTTNQNLGDIISFDSGFGNFTATRGNAGTVQVGAIFSNASAVATANTTVTINRTNPTITVRPASGVETTGARVPGGGWNRLFEARATYPSGFSQTLVGADVTWTNTASPALAALNVLGGRAELVTSTVPQTGSTTLTATYTNSQSGTAAGTHLVGIISYTLQNVGASLTPGLPADLRVIPGRASATNGFVRPVTVIATFSDRNAAGNNLVMPLFTNPSANSMTRAGALSLYLNPGTFPSTTTAFTGSLGSQARDTRSTIQLLTTAITPVGYTHLLRNVTTAFYNQNVLNIRVVHLSAPNLATLTTGGSVIVSGAASAEIAGSQAGVPGDRDTARTASINNITLDGNTSFALTTTNTNLRRGQGTNATMRASYTQAGAATEDVTALTDFLLSQNAANARIGNVTNGIGEVKGRLYIQAPPGGGAGNVVVGARYPHAAPGGDTANVTVNITLP